MPGTSSRRSAAESYSSGLFLVSFKQVEHRRALLVSAQGAWRQAWGRVRRSTVLTSQRACRKLYLEAEGTQLLATWPSRYHRQLLRRAGTSVSGSRSTPGVGVALSMGPPVHLEAVVAKSSEPAEVWSLSWAPGSLVRRPGFREVHLCTVLRHLKARSMRR